MFRVAYATENLCKNVVFFPYKSKIAPPHSFSLCSSAVRFRYSYSNYRQTFSSSIALCMSYLVNSFCLYFAFFCRLFGVKGSAYQLWYVLSFLFYLKFLKKSSLYVLTSCEITKIQKFTHSSFLFTHFRYLSALSVCKNIPTFTKHTKLPTPVIFVKRSGFLFENHSPRRLVRFLVVCRIRLGEVIDAINKIF